jgi:uncharacterized membrane protein YeaQ/YmgE (transglycosylase-associated protein family)
MNGVGWIGAIIIGGLAGWAAEKVMKSDMGLIMNIVLGIVGALVLNAILAMLGVITADGWLIQFIVALVGACLLIWIWRMIQGRRA